MASIAILDPVSETRELLERLLRRLGHEVLPDGAEPSGVAALVFEASSPGCVDEARRLRDAHPGLGLVACSAAPLERSIADLRPLEVLVQPFSPAQLTRALTDVLPAQAA